MEILVEQLIEVLQEQNNIGIWDIISIVASILAPIISLVATIIAFIVMKDTINKNKNDLEAAKYNEMLHSQSLYPIVKYNPLELNIFDDLLYGRLTPKGLSVSNVINNNGYEVCEIRVDNGIIVKDKKPAVIIPFELSNISDAIITEIRLQKLTIFQPREFKGDNLRLEAVDFIPEHQTIMMKDLFQKNDKFNVALSIYLDAEEYLKHFSSDLVQFRLFLSLKIITGLSFNELITVESSKAEYAFDNDNEIELGYHRFHIFQLIKVN